MSFQGNVGSIFVQQRPLPQADVKIFQINRALTVGPMFSIDMENLAVRQFMCLVICSVALQERCEERISIALQSSALTKVYGPTILREESHATVGNSNDAAIAILRLSFNFDQT